MRPKGIVLSGCLLFMGMIVFSSWVAWAGEKPVHDLPDDFFWKVIGAGSVLIMAVVGYQIRQRDQLLDKMAHIIYGNEDNPGLITRTALLEKTIDTCPECTPGYHNRIGETEKHRHTRIKGKQP